VEDEDDVDLLMLYNNENT